MCASGGTYVVHPPALLVFLAHLSYHRHKLSAQRCEWDFWSVAQSGTSQFTKVYSIFGLHLRTARQIDRLQATAVRVLIASNFCSNAYCRSALQECVVSGFDLCATHGKNTERQQEQATHPSLHFWRSREYSRANQYILATAISQPLMIGRVLPENGGCG